MSSLVKVYAGRTATERAAERRERLLDAGLELIGTRGLAAATVRAVIDEAGVAPRYFYESFGSVEELQLAVFDRVLALAEERGLAALRAPARGPRPRIRAVLAAMVDLMLEDPRRGRVVLIEALGAPALGERRLAEVQRFAGLLAFHSARALGGRESGSRAARVTSQFAVGGFAETMALVLKGQFVVDRDDLVNDLTELFVGLGPSFGRMAEDHGPADGAG